MRNLIHCRRGSAAFATVIAMVPLAGALALGAEAGSWYVVKQHAQNAADSAAMSGAMTVAVNNAASTSVTDSQTYDYRGKQFAAQNSFCNAGDTSYAGSKCTSLPSGLSRTVQIDRGSYASPNWTTDAGGSSVRATVSQQQPAYLTKLLGLSTVNINAMAVAEVKNPKDVCALGLGPSENALTIGGSSTITGNGCALMSDNTVKYNSTANFTGSGWAVNAVSGCVASAGHCDLTVPYNYNMLPTTNPLKALDTASFNSRTGPSTKPCGGNVTNGQICDLSPNSSAGVYSDLKVNSGGTVNFAPGTYFFYKASLDFSGTVNGTGVTFVLLGDSKLSISSTAIVDLSAPTTNTFSSLLNGVLIDDQAPDKSNNDVTINGSGSVKLGGVMYFPSVEVSWGGTTASSFTTCTSVVADKITINGNAYLSAQGCAPGSTAKTQVVVLVR